MNNLEPRVTILSEKDAQTAQRVARLANDVVGLVKEFYAAPHDKQTTVAYRAGLFDRVAALVVSYAADADKERGR